ncbi:hypothetical protein [Bacillus marinisedimentorum]|uniref:hypothetical protein n=1 Tax=Bacillus marinisedimentorum TaxID=1821260 RepID=UPI000872F571|nr:hypothetical protein [Bacillus marinisedimentorum]
MSENKKRVIKVDRLFVDADEVIIRPRERRRDHHRDRFDPWFGGRRGRGAERGLESSGRGHHRESHESSGLGPESSGLKHESSERRRRRFW